MGATRWQMVWKVVLPAARNGLMAAVLLGVEADGDADRLGRPVPGTLVRAPWLGPNFAQVILSIYELDGSPCVYDPRHVLRRVIERFKDSDMVPVYRRLREKGRMLPDGLKYIDSWIEPSLDRCFQLMETDDLRLFQKWVSAWNDLMRFEIIPVVPSKETREVMAGRG